MKIAITDANIFIDLIKLELFGCLFKLNFEIHTTREVYDQLKSEQKIIAKTYEDNGLLKIRDFTFEELSDIYEMECPSGLELADKTVYYYSTKTEAIVLSGDQKLRKFCLLKKIEVKGLIWLFDEFIARQLISKSIAIEKMEHLLSFNDRLPMAECHSRILNWKTDTLI
jgi:rRNA-processing protein FCF1